MFAQTLPKVFRKLLREIEQDYSTIKLLKGTPRYQRY